MILVCFMYGRIKQQYLGSLRTFSRIHFSNVPMKYIESGPPGLYFHVHEEELSSDSTLDKGFAKAIVGVLFAIVEQCQPVARKQGIDYWAIS